MKNQTRSDRKYHTRPKQMYNWDTMPLPGHALEGAMGNTVSDTLVRDGGLELDGDEVFASPPKAVILEFVNWIGTKELSYAGAMPSTTNGKVVVEFD